MTELTQLKQRLNSFLLDKQPAQIAETYRAIVAQDPRFCLVPGAQFDLGRYLERGGFPQLALSAYEALISHQPNAPITVRALLQAARLCAILPRTEDRGRQYIEAFLRTSPPEPDREEAIRLLSAFRGESGFVISRNEPYPSSAQSDPPMPPPSPPFHSAINPPSAGAARSMPDSDVLIKDPEPSPLPEAQGLVRLNLEEIQQSLAPTPIESSGPFFDDLESEVSGHQILFEYSYDKDAAAHQPERRPHASNAPTNLDDDPISSIIAQQAHELTVADDPISPPTPRPQTASQFLKRAEELQQQYDDLRRKNDQIRQERLAAIGDARFAIILPLHRPIHPKRIAKLLSPHLERSPQRILEIMKNGKGIIFDNLQISNFQDLVKITRPVSPDLLYIQISPKLQFTPPLDILRLELNDHGGRAIAQDREVPFLWGEVLLVGAGRVYLDELRQSGKNVVDIFLSRDQLHLRIWDATFQYKSSGLQFDALGDRNYLKLVDMLAQAAPADVRFSPTALRLIERGESMPQRFESINSYDRYNRWLLMNYFGKRVKI